MTHVLPLQTANSEDSRVSSTNCKFWRHACSI